MIDRSSSLIDVAFAACTALERADALAVLCGGSAATFYCASHQSLDADFVLRFETKGSIVDEALRSIGYARDASNVYSHALVDFTIEFPAGPLAIGRKYVQTWNTVKRNGETLHVVTAEDCVCDRFLHFWAWGDRSAREVALNVARSVPSLDVVAIEEWAADEMSATPLYDARAWANFNERLREARRGA